MYGQRIRELRLEKGYSQQKLAKEFNITQKTLSKYENEELDLNTPILIKICDFFDVPADYILGRTDY